MGFITIPATLPSALTYLESYFWLPKLGFLVGLETFSSSFRLSSHCFLYLKMYLVGTGVIGRVGHMPYRGPMGC